MTMMAITLNELDVCNVTMDAAREHWPAVWLARLSSMIPYAMTIQYDHCMHIAIQCID
jgi:hypothetical protein